MRRWSGCGVSEHWSRAQWVALGVVCLITLAALVYTLTYSMNQV